MLLIVAIASQEDVGNKIVDTVLMSQICSDVVIRAGSASLHAVSAFSGEHTEKQVASTKYLIVFSRLLQRCPASRPLSHWCHW